MTIQTRNAAGTAELGRLIGAELRGGEVIALSGALGAGKTQFVKGLALGLGVPADEPVVSPTFVLVREYAARPEGIPAGAGTAEDSGSSGGRSDRTSANQETGTDSNSSRGRLRLIHIDAYRLSGGAELAALGIDEMFADPRSVIAIEWADRVSDALPASTAWIQIEHTGGDGREIHLNVSGSPRFAAIDAAVRVSGLLPAIR